MPRPPKLEYDKEGERKPRVCPYCRSSKLKPDTIEGWLWCLRCKACFYVARSP